MILAIIFSISFLNAVISVTLYKLKKAYYEPFYPYIRVTEYVRDLLFYKLLVQKKGKSRFVGYNFFRTLTSKKRFLHVTYARTQFVNP